MPNRRLTLAVAAPLAALALPSAAQAAKKPSFYVSLGDSYASGYQATGAGVGENTRNGFAYQLVGKARKRGHRLKLVNFGCGGETTTSILERKTPCGRGSSPGGPKYDGRTQVAAAERFLRRNRGKVSLITVSIGGNDVTACARAADPVACVGTAVTGIKENGGALVKRLRKAAGRKVRIVGITYPDVILGEWVGAQPNRDLAGLSVVAFRSLINPALKKVYESVRGRFVDVTKATGAYGSLEQMTTLAPYGEVPVPVAEVCRLTYYCAFRDIHANAQGYGIIAGLIAKTLSRRKG